MHFTRPLVAAIGLSMAASPALAQSAAPLSLAPAAAEMAQSNDLEGRGYFLPAIIIIGVLAAAILYTSNHSDDRDHPVSA